MFCKKCGAPLEDGAKFCPNCGANQIVNTEPVQQNTPQPAQTAPVREQPTVVQQPAYPPQTPAPQTYYANTAPNTVYAPAPQPAAQYPAQNTVYVQNPQAQAPRPVPQPAPQPTAPNGFAVNAPAPAPAKKPKKKMKTGVKVLLGVGIPVLVLAIAAAVLFFTGMFDKWFPKDVKTVTKSSSEKFFEEVTDAYENIVFNGKEKYLNGSYEMGIELSESLTSLLETMTGVDLTWAKSMSVEYSISADDRYIILATKFILNDTALLDGNMAYDMSENVIYVSFPDLFKKSMEIDLDGLMKNMSNSDMESLEMFKALFSIDYSKYLPDGDTLESLLNKYFGIILDAVGDPVEKEETVTVEGVSQKMRVATYSITEKKASKALEDVLKEAKKDSEIKSIITKFEGLIDELEETTGEDILYGDLYEMYTEGVSELLEDLEYEDYNSDTELSVTLYIESNEVEGLSIAIEGFEMFRCLATKDSGDFGVELVVYSEYDGEVASLSGRGEYSGDEYSGNIILSVEGEEITITLDELSVEDGQLDGTISIPLDQFADEMGDYSLESILAGSSIDLVFDYEDGHQKIGFDFVMGGETLIGFDFGYSSNPAVDAKTYQIPSGTVVIDDPDDFEDWATTLDFDALLQSLEDAGVADELLDALFGAIGGFDDFYDYGDYDDYWDW